MCGHEKEKQDRKERLVELATERNDETTTPPLIQRMTNSRRQNWLVDERTIVNNMEITKIHWESMKIDGNTCKSIEMN